jgi:hypothetical protein
MLGRQDHRKLVVAALAQEVGLVLVLVKGLELVLVKGLELALERGLGSVALALGLALQWKHRFRISVRSFL